MKKILMFTVIAFSSLIFSSNIDHDVSTEMEFSFLETPAAHASALFGDKDGIYSSWACGFKPFPPFGCEIGRCVCDSDGRNCEWEIVCD